MNAQHLPSNEDVLARLEPWTGTVPAGYIPTFLVLERQLSSAPIGSNEMKSPKHSPARVKSLILCPRSVMERCSLSKQI